MEIKLTLLVSQCDLEVSRKRSMLKNYFSFNYKIVLYFKQSQTNNYIEVNINITLYWLGVVACTCNPATLEAEFRNSAGSIQLGATVFRYVGGLGDHL